MSKQAMELAREALLKGCDTLYGIDLRTKALKALDTAIEQHGKPFAYYLTRNGAESGERGFLAFGVAEDAHEYELNVTPLFTSADGTEGPHYEITSISYLAGELRLRCVTGNGQIPQELTAADIVTLSVSSKQ